MRIFAERSKQPLENDELLTLIKELKLRWFCHISMSSSLAKPVLQGTVKKRIKSIQKKRWEDTIEELTGMDVFGSSTRVAEDRPS